MGWLGDLLQGVLELLYRPCDWALGWTSLLGPAAAVAAVGVLSGIAIILIQKYGSDQDLLGRCREDLRQLKGRIREARRAGDRASVDRLSALSRRIGGKYMGRSLVPALWTVPLITVVGLWTGSRLAFIPVRPGDVVEVVAHFEDGAAGFAHLLAGGSLRREGPAIAAVEVPPGARGRQARWNVRSLGEGKGTVLVRFSDVSYEMEIPVFRRGGRAPLPVRVFHEQTPGQDQLQALELRLRPSMRAAWWNLWLDWAGLYLVSAVACALGLRYALKVK